MSQTDFTEDLERITVPVPVMPGEDDQVVPYADSVPFATKLLRIPGAREPIPLESITYSRGTSANLLLL